MRKDPVPHVGVKCLVIEPHERLVGGLPEEAIDLQIGLPQHVFLRLDLPQEPCPFVGHFLRDIIVGSAAAPQAVAESRRNRSGNWPSRSCSSRRNWEFFFVISLVAAASRLKSLPTTTVFCSSMKHAGF